MGMLLDFIPEALALGGMLVGNAPTALLLTVLIGLQNLPEGFNAYRELKHADKNQPSKILAFMSALVVLGPLAGLTGYFFLAHYTFTLGAIMLFAGGGILYLIFQDIAPQSKLEKHWAPPLGAVAGFCIAVVGQLILEKL